jgi:hypothetical protein
MKYIKSLAAVSLLLASTSLTKAATVYLDPLVGATTQTFPFISLCRGECVQFYTSSPVFDVNPGDTIDFGTITLSLTYTAISHNLQYLLQFTPSLGVTFGNDIFNGFYPGNVHNTGLPVCKISNPTCVNNLVPSPPVISHSLCSA